MVADVRVAVGGAVFLSDAVTEAEEQAMSENTQMRTLDAVASRDRLLLAFAELEMYGIAARDAVDAEPGRTRARLSVQLRAGAPHALGSYVFWVRADEAGSVGQLPLYTSGAEVDRAVVAACAHHGLTVRPDPRPGVLLVAW